MTSRLSRRTFLKIGLSLGLATQWPSAAGLSLAAHYPFSLNALTDVRGYDLALVPADLAAELIQRNALRPLKGPPNRPHDPEGAYTIPGAQVIANPPQAEWPDLPRFVIGHALLRRGYSPNDTHAGHLAQIETDLLNLKPRVRRDRQANIDLRASNTIATLIILTKQEAALSNGNMISPGALGLEYDWVIPIHSTRPHAAEDFALAHQTTHLLPVGVTPIASVPACTRLHHQRIWKTVSQRQ